MTIKDDPNSRSLLTASARRRIRSQKASASSCQVDNLNLEINGLNQRVQYLEWLMHFHVQQAAAFSQAPVAHAELQPEVKPNPQQVSLPCNWSAECSPVLAIDPPNLDHIRMVSQELETLKANLCATLYGEGINPGVLHLYFSTFDDGEHKGMDDEDGMDSHILHNTEDLRDDHLDEIRRNIAKSLFCLEDWALWKKRGYSDEEASSAVEGRFECGHIGRTPDGWVYIEEDFDAEDETELQNMEMNRLGHMFTFRRAEFWQYCRCAPDDLRRSVTTFAVNHPMVQLAPDLAFPDFERAYFDNAVAAFEWQEHYSDSDEADDLVALLQMLRALVNSNLVERLS